MSRLSREFHAQKQRLKNVPISAQEAATPLAPAQFPGLDVDEYDVYDNDYDQMPDYSPCFIGLQMIG
jgi:hypothetical protein